MTTDGFHFWGRIGSVEASPGRASDAARTRAGMWRYENDEFAIAVGGEHARSTVAWLDSAARPSDPFVLVAGSLYLGSDGEYSESTSVTALSIESAPAVIARHFKLYGTGAFARLDGDFSLVLLDPETKDLYLVVDKLGCSDIYVRTTGNSLLFASRPSDLIDDDDQFDLLPVAFLLAHEGFIPAPFTVTPEVKSVGRARFARIALADGKVRCEFQTYWRPVARWNLPSTATARAKFFTVLDGAVALRMGSKSSVLLSGGVDSSLVMNLAAARDNGTLVALTGSVKGWEQGEQEIAHSRNIAKHFGVPHQTVVLDPQDETLPQESYLCSTSWMNGVRLTLPLWRRFALCLRECLGDGYNVVAGQTADTLADNNYTLPSMGYTLRRAFFSSWFLRAMPLVKAISPRTGGILGLAAVASTKSLAGARMAGMLRSVLDGISARELFYAGRVFGYGEMPGVAGAYFPMLKPQGFDRVVDWYCSNFIRPLVWELDSSNFYRQMIQMSMDMNMLHLDSRLLFHVYRQEGGRAQLPFMDARVVTFFASMPYSARAVYREPKHIIRCQLRREGMRYQPKPSGNGSSRLSKSQEQLLLEGTLGTYYRELLQEPTFPSRAPRLFELVDERYFEKQLAGFRNGREGINHRFVAKIGALELWSRALSSRLTGKLAFPGRPTKESAGYEATGVSNRAQ
jgi:hypothetical protein